MEEPTTPKVDELMSQIVVEESPTKMGRPSDYTQELADEICHRLAIGESLRTVCKGEDMPSVATIFNWFRKYPDFLDQYARAKQESADAMSEEIMDIADDGTNDWMEVETQNGSYLKVNNEAVQRSKLRVETRKWLMSKMKPKKYGDKIDVTSDGHKIAPTIVGMQIIDESKNDGDSAS